MSNAPPPRKRFDEMAELSRELDDLLLEESTSFKDAVDFCQKAMQWADEKGFELGHLHFGARLADLYVDSGRLEKGLNAYRRLWPRKLAPLFFGLQVMKGTLRSKRIKKHRLKEGERLLQEMAQRLEEERSDPQRQGHLLWEETNLLFARGLFQLEQDQEFELKRTCSELASLVLRCPKENHFDLELVVRLVQRRKIESAFEILDALVKRESNMSSAFSK